MIVKGNWFVSLWEIYITKLWWIVDQKQFWITVKAIFKSLTSGELFKRREFIETFHYLCSNTAFLDVAKNIVTATIATQPIKNKTTNSKVIGYTKKKFMQED